MRYKNLNYTTKFKQNKESTQKSISGPEGVIVLVFFIPKLFFIFLTLFTSLIKGNWFDSQNKSYF